MAKKIRKKNPHHRYIDTSFGGIDSKYYAVPVGEGIEMLKEDIKDIAIDSKESVEDLVAAYVESTKMEEGEWGKLPPLPTSWAAGILQLLKPVKGLYDLEKKTGGLGVSLFKTLAGDSSRRGFLKTIVGNSDKLRTKRILKKMTEDSKNYKSKFKWADTGPGSKFYKKLQEILNPTSPKGILKKAKADKKTFHAEGGIITVSDPGMGDGPFMMEEFLEAVKQGFKGTYDEYIDQIDRSPRDYLAEGGVIEEVWDKKGIEDAKESLEGMRPHLMEESYIQLLDFLDSKQKELDMDIMEDAGGLGEMLGEGGRAGFDTGGSSIRKYTIPPKVWPLVVEMYEKAGGRGQTGMSLKEFAFQYFNKAKGGRVGMMYGGDPGFAFSYGGSWADWKDNHASEMPLMDYINQKLPKPRNPFSNGGEIEISWEEVFAKHMQGQPLTDEERKILGQVPTEDKAEGGRVPMLAGGLLRTGIMEVLDPLLKGQWKGTLGSYRELLKRLGKQEVRADVDKVMPTIKSSRAINLAKSIREELLSKIKGYKEGFKGGYERIGDWKGELKWLIKETKKDLKRIDDFILKKEAGVATKHAEGGRIGMAGGMSAKRIDSKKRENYFRFNRDNYMNLFEYLQSEQAERDLEGAFKKGGKVKKGGIGDLMGELYRLFEIGPLLASPELIDVIQKIPFDKGGRVGFKKGQKVDLDRRMILKGIAALAALPAFKWLKFAKTKPVKDISVKLKSWIDDSDEMTEWGPQATGRWAGNFDISSLTPKGIAILKNLFGKSVKTVKDKSGKITASMDDVGTEDAAMYVDDIIKKGKGVIDFKYVDDIVGGTGSIDATLARYAKTFGKNSKAYKDLLKKSKKMTEKQKIQYELDEGYDPYVDDVLDLVYPSKGEGGSVGYPPLQPKENPPFQGPPYETNNPNEAIKEILRQGIGSGIAGAPIGGGFSLDMPYGVGSEFDIGLGYQTENPYGFAAGYGVDLEGDDTLGARYTGDTFNIGVKKQEGSDPQWKFEKKWKFGGPKNMKQGGKVWQPKSAPKLTTTIPPERGPTPQGLTYLTGDDIVQNIG